MQQVLQNMIKVKASRILVLWLYIMVCISRILLFYTDFCNINIC